MAEMKKVGEKLTVLELYSGIGGMHYALEESGLSYNVVAAIDINQISNSIYRHNFPETKLLTKCLTTLTLSDLNRFGADLVTMSPPCQPFTRVGRQKDLTDERTKSFLHFINLLPKLDKIPDYIFVENVKGFETSLTREILIEMLRKLDFVCQEFLLTPLQFSIPNSRLRYYLMAKRKPKTFCFEMQPTIYTTLPSVLKTEVDFVQSENSLPSIVNTNSGNLEDIIDRIGFDQQPDTQEIAECDAESPGNGKWYNFLNVVKRTLAEYLEDRPNEYFEKFLLPKKFYRYFWVMDLVQSTSTNSCCFTKRYGHHIDGAGSVIQMNSSENDLSKYRNLGTVVPELSAGIEMLQLRFFTPKEIANLLCFPTQFRIPDGITTLQSYRALGNSINIHIVSVLLRLLFS